MPKTKVYMMEIITGWGQKIEEIKTFANAYNKKYNNKRTTPSWYIKAVVEGDV